MAFYLTCRPGQRARALLLWQKLLHRHFVPWHFLPWPVLWSHTGFVQANLSNLDHVRMLQAFICVAGQLSLIRLAAKSGARAATVPCTSHQHALHASNPKMTHWYTVPVTVTDIDRDASWKVLRLIFKLGIDMACERERVRVEEREHVSAIRRTILMALFAAASGASDRSGAIRSPTWGDLEFDGSILFPHRIHLQRQRAAWRFVSFRTGPIHPARPADSNVRPCWVDSTAFPFVLPTSFDRL